MMKNMKNIKYVAFTTSVDLGSFSKAADYLGYTQSGLTHLMDRFEEDVGFKLVQRGFYGIRPTEKGKQLLPIVREIIRNEEALAIKIGQLKLNEKSIIKIGAYSSIAQNWLPSIVQKYNMDFPDVVIKIQTGAVTSLYSGLDEGVFDIIFVSENDKYNTGFIPLKKDEMLAVLPPNYYEGTLPKSFQLKNYDGKRFLMPGLGFNVDVLKTFKNNNVKPKIEETYLDDMAIMSMIELGLGISILSELIVKGRDSNLTILPLEPKTKRLLGIAYDKTKDLNEAVKNFIDYAKNYAKGIK